MKTYEIVKTIAYEKQPKLNPDDKIILNFDGKLALHYNYKLNFVGQTCLPLSRRTEEVFAVYYRKLDDSLLKSNNGYILTFNDENKVYERSCYLMIKEGFEIDKIYNFGVKYKASGIKNNFKLSIEIFYGKKNTRYYYDKCDEKIELKLSDSEDFKNLSTTLKFKREVAFVMLKLSAINFNGQAEVFSPYLINDGVDLAKPFAPSRDYNDFDWIGEGFSLTERPKFIIKVNGTEVFNGRKVETCDCFSGVEFSIPAGTLKQEDNVIEVEYPKENVKNFEIKEARLISMPKKFEILAVDSIVPLAKSFGVLVYSPSKVLPKITCEDFEFLGAENYKKGYNVLTFKPKKLGKKLKLKLNTRVCYLEVIDKQPDGIITGTGDAICVPQNTDDFVEYLSWYINNGVGKLLTFRSNYRWGRNSECNNKFWKEIIPLVCGMGIYYSMMIDGRELNGCNSAPDVKLIESEYFLGEQTHEMDGSYSYWAQQLNNPQVETFYHALSRKIKKTGIYGKCSPVYSDNGTPKLFYSEDAGSNVKEVYEQFLDNIKKTGAQGATRHTGVTPFFNTFLKVGYKWVGYESMYGTHELLFGAVRAMSKSIGQNSFGAHAALQWSTMPLETRGHLLRYQISLNLSYMHGVTEINTEEGLWRFSNGYVDYDHFSKPCIDHLNVQRKFNEFVTRNERKGKLKTDIAMIMGKYDGNDCFSCAQVFGHTGEEWKKGAPEQSWDLLKVFYPQADINAIYYYIINGGVNAFSEKDKTLIETLKGLYRDVIDEKQVGYYTETPYGVIDIIDESADNYSDYKLLFFTGWNTADEAQLKKFCKFVENGGTLMLAKPHLYTSVDRAKVLKGKGEVIQSGYLKKLLSYVETGRVIYFDKDKFPINYKKDYAKALTEMAKKFGGKNVRNTNRISYTEYETDEGTVIYLQNIGWWTNKPATCEVKVDGEWKKIKVSGFDIKIIRL